MKPKEFQNIKNKPPEELEKDLRVYREKLRQLNFDLASGKVKNIREIRYVKRSIAQVRTLINQKAG
jgi:ribosomal protein L29